MLFKSVINLFDKAVADTQDLQKERLQASLAFNPESIPARRRFLVRRVKLLRNLIRWRKHTGERFGVGQSITRLVDGPLLSIAETGWDVGGEEIMKQVSVSSASRLIFTNYLLGFQHASRRTDVEYFKDPAHSSIRIYGCFSGGDSTFFRNRADPFL